MPTTGPNAKPGEKPPIMPLEATQHTPAGAKAFAEFFIKTIDWGYATTSSTYMRHYFTKSCVGCRSTADALDKAKRQKHHFIGDRFTIRRSVTSPSSQSTSVYFDVSSAEVVDQAGSFVDGYPALTNYREDLYASWVGDHWTVSRMVPKG